MFVTVHSASTVGLYIRVYPYIVCIVYTFVNYAKGAKQRFLCILCTHTLVECATMHERCSVHAVEMG